MFRPLLIVEILKHAQASTHTRANSFLLSTAVLSLPPLFYLSLSLSQLSAVDESLPDAPAAADSEPAPAAGEGGGLLAEKIKPRKALPPLLQPVSQVRLSCSISGSIPSPFRVVSALWVGAVAAPCAAAAAAASVPGPSE